MWFPALGERAAPASRSRPSDASSEAVFARLVEPDLGPGLDPLEILVGHQLAAGADVRVRITALQLDPGAGRAHEAHDIELLVDAPLHPALGDLLLVRGRDIGRADRDGAWLDAALLECLDNRVRVAGTDRRDQPVALLVDLRGPLLDRFGQLAEAAVREGLELVAGAVSGVVGLDARLAAVLALV